MFWALQDVSHTLQNPRIHYHVHIKSPIFHDLSKMNPIHTFPSYFLKVSFNIIFPCKTKSFKRTLPLGVSTPQKIYMPSPFISLHFKPLYIHFSLFSHPENICRRINLTKLFFMHFYPAVYYCLTRRKNVSLSALFSNKPEAIFCA